MTDAQAALLATRAIAVALFQQIEREAIVGAGQTEASISQAIFELAAERFGTRTHWHRRLVRSGPNTRLPFSARTPDRVVEADDIVSLDLGPVFGEYEADFGRSYVLGDDAEKLRLCTALEPLFESCRARYLERPQLTGAEYYALVVQACAAQGWGFGGAHAGHLVGRFPLAREQRDAACNRIRPDNAVPMNAADERGEPRSWILEIHLLDPSGQFGGFFEDLLVEPR